MDSRKKASMVQTAPHPALPIYERCTCKLLSASAEEREETYEEDVEHNVPISDELHQTLHAHIAMYFPHRQPLSLLLFHLAQQEQANVHGQATLTGKRRRYHTAPGVLEQVLTNVQRAIRHSDVLLVHTHVGAALIFLDVDEQGAYVILERVYNSISLLQAETIVPPLKRETSVLLGIGTTMTTDTSPQDVCIRAGRVARAFHLRPLIPASPWHERIDTPASIVPFPTIQQRKMRSNDEEENGENRESKLTLAKVPFMALPAEIPPRLKHFIPYKMAVQIRCVPIGRNHHCLTVAMSNPHNVSNIQRLAELTGMTIFPIACDEDALDLLLDRPW